MKKETLNEIRDKFVKRKLIDEYLLSEYIKGRINEEGTQNYINTVIVSSDVESEYNARKEILSFNPNEILFNKKNTKIPDLLSIISNKERKDNLIIDANNVNLYNIFTINHELSHVHQNLLRSHDFSSMDDFTL